MNISRRIKPQIINYDKEVIAKDEERILNMVDMDKVHNKTMIKFTPNDYENILDIPECYKNIRIIIQLAIDYDIIFNAPIPDGCEIVVQLEMSSHYFNKVILARQIIDLLKALPANTKTLELQSIFIYEDLFNLEVVQYLPRNLKEFFTMVNCIEPLDNIPPELECLSVTPAISINYSYAFLPLTLHTLEIKNDHCSNNGYTNVIVLPELVHLPPGLKVLVLDSYTHNLSSLTEGLEKLTITRYHYRPDQTGEDIRIPPNLKIFQIVKCWNLFIREYPATLEHLDIDNKVDISLLPPTLKSVGLYGFLLGRDIVELPENITTVYTRDVYITKLPSHVKRVFVSISTFDEYQSMSICVGDVTVKINSYNSDEIFRV